MTINLSAVVYILTDSTGGILSTNDRTHPVQCPSGCGPSYIMIVDLLLLLVGLVVFLYDLVTFPLYWIVQQPWRKE